MKKRVLVILIVILSILSLFLLIYPHLEFRINNKLILFRYTDIVPEIDEHTCYDDSYSYVKSRDISIIHYDAKKYFFFYIITLEYKEGNICDTEYLLEETYIENFINNAEIIYNDNNINLEKLIYNKTPIVGNKRYVGNDYQNFITYKLDGKYNILYIFYIDELLVIQVGYSDEGPKFIAYK